MAQVASRARKPVTVALTVDAMLNLGPMRIGRFALGQGGLSAHPMFEAHVDSIRWLAPSVIRLFVQEYFQVYPARGVYDWSRLDRAIDAILATGAQPLLSLCIKPPVLYPDVKDQDKVHPSDYGEWEELIYRFVRHYVERNGLTGLYWEVFNEPDIGESGGCPGRFTSRDYVVYYEHTTRAIRRADPSARVGGPALAYYKSPLLRALLEHCAAEKSPLDFVSWHYYTSDPGVIVQSVRDVKALLAEFPGLSCETLITEWNISLGWETVQNEFQPAYVLETTYRMMEEGLDLATYYHIREWHVSRDEFLPFMSDKGASFMAWWWNINLQYHGIFDFQGTMRPAFFSFRMLSLLTGDRLAVSGGASTENVHALAAYDPSYEALHVVAWNFGVETPPDAHLTLELANLPGTKWELRRRMLDSTTPSNLEGDRLRLADNRNCQGSALSVEFDVPAYGAALLSFRRLE